MLCDTSLSTNTCRGSTTTTKRTTTSANLMTRRMSSNHSFRLALVVLAILGLPVLMVSASPFGRSARTIRLCSRDLSDALNLVCKFYGGFYEPYTYNAENSRRRRSGRGLVDDCCINACRWEDLRGYCKEEGQNTDEKRPDDSHDGMKESLRIVNLPYTSTGEKATQSRDGAAIENNEKIAKSFT